MQQIGFKRNEGNELVESKRTIRKAMVTAFAQIEDDEQEDISKQLQEELFASDLWKNAQAIGTYLSIGSEWDTLNIVKQALAEGKEVAVPKTMPETKELLFYGITDMDQTTTGNFGLIEPIVTETQRTEKDAIDLLIVPGLVFTKEGYRVGFGGGYYDRFLTDFIHTTVSLVHTNQLVNSFPIEPFDIPVNYLVTEKGILG